MSYQLAIHPTPSDQHLGAKRNSCPKRSAEAGHQDLSTRLRVYAEASNLRPIPTQRELTFTGVGVNLWWQTCHPKKLQHKHGLPQHDVKQHANRCRYQPREAPKYRPTSARRANVIRCRYQPPAAILPREEVFRGLPQHDVSSRHPVLISTQCVTHT